MEVEMAELVSAFDNAYLTAWECCEDINQYIKDHYNGDKEKFLSDISHNCDYCSVSSALKTVMNEIEKSIS